MIQIKNGPLALFLITVCQYAIAQDAPRLVIPLGARLVFDGFKDGKGYPPVYKISDVKIEKRACIQIRRNKVISVTEVGPLLEKDLVKRMKLRLKDGKYVAYIFCSNLTDPNYRVYIAASEKCS